MDLLCVGLDHRRTPIALREKLFLNVEQTANVLARFAAHPPDRVSELTILSTCNRIEFYALADTGRERMLAELLSRASSVPSSHFQSQLIRRRGTAVAEHLMRVACGLDSQVLGEPQILGQVGRGHHAALQAGASGPVLTRLFQSALHAGKRARAETAIATQPATVSSVAIALAEQVVGDLHPARVLVIGAGEMAALAVEALSKRGAGQIRIVNRSTARARALAGRWGVEQGSFEALQEELVRADIVICSSGASHYLLDARAIDQAMQSRPARPLLIIDTAVPRDVDPAAGHIQAVQLYDLDQLHARLDHALDLRRREIPQIERLIAQQMDDFCAWLEARAVTPLIRALHEQAEAIREQELARSLRRLPGISASEQRQIETFSRALTRKLLQAPTLCLKNQSQNGQLTLYQNVVSRLFALDTDQPSTDREGRGG